MVRHDEMPAGRRTRAESTVDTPTGRALALVGRLHGVLLAAGASGRPIPVVLAETLVRLFAGEGGADPNPDPGYRALVREAAELDWSQVSPTIFGSVRQLARSIPARRPLGEHYTTEENVRKTLDPLLFDELREQLRAAGDAADLHRLWDRLAAVRLLDPACGCGNFLVVGYRDLRALESQVMRRLAGLGEPVGVSRIPLRHLYGIELDEYSAALARTALRAARAQCDGAMAGDQRDSALAGDQRDSALAGDHRAGAPVGDQYAGAPVGADEPHIVAGVSALCLDWAGLVPPSADVVIAGNPPFSGHKERTAAQGSELRTAWRSSAVRHLDYSTGWFAKALEYFGDVPGRWAFVATNSVVQGETVPRLFRPIFDAGWRIAFAHRTFAWSATAYAAAVHVVIIGFSRDHDRSADRCDQSADRGSDRGTGRSGARLFDYRLPSSTAIEIRAAHINGYLVDGPDVLVEPAARPLSAELPPIRAGSTGIDWGHLTVEPADIGQVRADPYAARYLRRFVGGRELINDRERWCLWMADPDFEPADLLRSKVLGTRVDLVRRLRAAAARAATRRLAQAPHLFGEVRQPTGRYLAMPQTFTENRPHATAARLGPEVIASVKLFTAPDPDGLLFAIFSSSMFLTWQRTVGGRLKSDPSLSASVVWNTFPLPRLDPAGRRRIAEGGQRVLAARERTWSLARQYAPGAMPERLVQAHAELDELVDAAFGAPGRCTRPRQRQLLLFERYLGLTQSSSASTSRARRPSGSG